MISLYTESHRRESEIARMLTRPKSTVYDVINNYLIVIRWKINKEVEDQNLLRSVITANSKDLSNRTEGAVGVTLVHSLIKSGTRLSSICFYATIYKQIHVKTHNQA
jgi:hypothetical protein